MATYYELITNMTNKAIEKNLEESAIIRLMLHFSGLESYKLYAEQNQECPEQIEKAFIEGCLKYIDKLIPVQHITGFETFYGYEFMVNNDVLIPRFETEELVENLLYEFDDFLGYECDVVDIGTGSGAIAITLAKEEKKMHLKATDISPDAVEMAKKNACNLGANVEFLVGDMLEPVMNQKFDILVSNPPYIPDSEYVEPLVKNNEPQIALFGGNDGLKFYRVILENALNIVKPRSIIAFEHAFNTGDALRDLIKFHFPLAKVKSLNDMAGKDRMIFIFNEDTKINKGETLIFPTDTVYGLACLYNDEEAKEKIVAMKDRDPFKKIAVLCANIEQIESIANVSEDARKIIDSFLPGPLTLILPGKDCETIGVRIPDSNIAKKILLDNGPLMATSVNKSGDTPLSNKDEIEKEFGSLVDHLFLCDCEFSGVSSTVVDMTMGLKILREGSITLREIENCLK